jgi:hypothetical protein
MDLGTRPPSSVRRTAGLECFRRKSISLGRQGNVANRGFGAHSVPARSSLEAISGTRLCSRRSARQEARKAGVR